jgi:hypothetical protein
MSKAIDVDILQVMKFLEQQFPNPEARWGELKALIHTQKAAQQRVNPAGCTCGAKNDIHASTCPKSGWYVESASG